MLTNDGILALKPGDKVKVTGICFDQTPWTREGTLTENPVQKGYYQVGGLGTWALYDISAQTGEIWLPSYSVSIRPKGKQIPHLYQTSDVLTVERI